MSNAPLHSDSNTVGEPTTTDQRLATRVRQIPASVVTAGRAVGFWTAVGLPFLYLPWLAIGLDTPGELLVFLGLLVVNVLALVAGRSHRRD